MSRIQLSISVSDFDAAVAFYSRLFGAAPDWLRLARLARVLSWLTLAWMGIEGGVAIGAAIAAGSVALLGFGLDSGIEVQRTAESFFRVAPPVRVRRGVSA